MSITGITLVDGSRELVLLPSTQLRVNALEAPFPEVRAVAEPRTDASGEVDTTELHGGRAVSLNIRVIDQASRNVNDLAGFCHPRARPYLVVDDDEWDGPRRIALRVDQFSAPLGVELPPSMVDVHVSWRAPDGVWETVTAYEETISADLDASDGINFPISFPLAFAVTAGSGARLITNTGNTTAEFRVRLYGPCTGPRLTNQTTGATLDLSGESNGTQLVIPAGDYVEVDTRARTVTSSDGAASRLNYVDFTASTWWDLLPGGNQVRYWPVTAGPGSAAVLTFHPAWL